mgnify:FL=1
MSGKNKNNKHSSELTAKSIFDQFAKNKSAALVAAVATLGMFNAHAEGPAVSELNAKVEGVGGFIDGEGTGIGAVSVAVPVVHSFGAQIDGMGGTTDGDSLVGYGAHLFWRNAEKGLLGGTVARSGRSGSFVNRYGAEGEYYLDQWTLGATGGSQTGFLGGTWYGSLVAKYYITDNLMIDVSGQGFSDSRVGQIGLEWQPQTMIDGLSFFAVGGAGSDDLDYGMVGVKWYFGGSDKSLKLRHREDDPINSLIGAASGLNNAIVQEEASRKAAGTTAAAVLRQVSS